MNLFVGFIVTITVIVVLAMVAGAVLRKYVASNADVAPRSKGALGESSVNQCVRRELDQDTYSLIPDIILASAAGTTQIDHVIVSRYGIFVVETKNYNGWIYGGEQEAQWTQAVFRRKHRFQNPLRQNYRHTKTLSDLTGIPEEYFKPVVVFVGDCEFKTNMPSNVMHISNFSRYIESFQHPIIKEAQVPEVTEAIRSWSEAVTDEQRATHVEHVHLNRQPVPVDAGTPACPNCGEAMVLRTSRKEGNTFWGCSTFPKCRGIRQAV